MSRDPIAALIQLADLKVDQARMDHAQAQAAVAHIRQSIDIMRGHIADEQDHALSETGQCSVLAHHGIELLSLRLAMENKFRADLEQKVSQTLSLLRAAILAKERFVIHQSRIRHHHEQIRQRREIAGLEDLYLGRPGITARPEQ